MNLDVLETLATSRAKLVANQKEPPFVAHLASGRATQLRAEMAALGVAFGIPLMGNVPDSREDGEWFYMGVVLADVHVFARIDPA